MIKLSSANTTCRDISELTPSAQIACNLFLTQCKTKGLNVLITETYRSQERQNYLYEQGRTRAGKIVTWTKNSRHTSRRAWDICKNVKGHEFDDANFFKACGAVASELNITWGGTWSTPDMPHFEISEQWVKPTDIGDDEMTLEEKEKFKKAIESINNLAKAYAELNNEVRKLGEHLTALENPIIYNLIDDTMPEYARPTIKKLYEKGYLKGDINGHLNLDENILRVLTILDRSGTFD